MMKRTVSISIEKETLERFKEQARTEKRSVSQLVEILMEERMAAQKKQRVDVQNS